MTERTVEFLRNLHTEMTSLKAQLLDEKMAFHREASTTLRDLEVQAKKQALTTLSSHSDQILAENTRLRKEVFDLIRANKSLQEKEAALTKQNKCEWPLQMQPAAHLSYSIRELARQVEINEDLGLLRSRGPRV